jgi:hypothetical protein
MSGLFEVPFSTFSSSHKLSSLTILTAAPIDPIFCFKVYLYQIQMDNLSSALYGRGERTHGPHKCFSTATEGRVGFLAALAESTEPHASPSWGATTPLPAATTRTVVAQAIRELRQLASPMSKPETLSYPTPYGSTPRPQPVADNDLLCSRRVRP